MDYSPPLTPDSHQFHPPTGSHLTLCVYIMCLTLTLSIPPLRFIRPVAYISTLFLLRLKTIPPALSCVFTCWSVGL